MTTEEAIKNFSYDSLVYKISFGTAACFRVAEKNFNVLERLSKTEPEPLKYSGRAAILYGVSGLLLHIDVYTQQIKDAFFKENEIIEQDAIRILGELAFAKTLLCDLKESKAIASMDAMMPGVQYEKPAFWSTKEKKLFDLLEKSQDYNAEFIQQEIKNVSNTLLDACVTTLSPRSPQKSF